MKVTGDIKDDRQLPSNQFGNHNLLTCRVTVTGDTKMTVA